ncbi:MAG: hypothetical protein ACLFPU_06965 [Dehalococcoidia bacterium]
MVKKSDYSEPEVQASFSVMAELMTILGEYRDNIVLVGGSVPPLLIPSAEKEYPGTLDIDLALDFENISSIAYKTIVKTLESRGYYQGSEQPFIFYRDVEIKPGETTRIQVDLLGGEYGGTGTKHRHQRVQDAQVRKARGCDLVFDAPLTVKLEGTLPNGATNEVSIKIPSVGPFLVTKGMALWGRLKEKDAFDIYFCCRYFPSGIEALADAIKPVIGNRLAKEGLGKIKARFNEVSGVGPVGVADFMELEDQEERGRIQREAFEFVNKLMELLEIDSFSG